MIELITYKMLKEKYPEAKEDIERLQASKNHAIIAIFISGLFFGFAFATWIL